jgi:hypothetical protein
VDENSALARGEAEVDFLLQSCEKRLVDFRYLVDVVSQFWTFFINDSSLVFLVICKHSSFLRDSEMV